MRMLAAVLLLVPLLPQDDPTLQGMIERLSDDEIRVREKAASDLVDRGKAAIPLLKRLLASGDIELRSRASSILQRIAEGEVIGLHWKRGPRITLKSDGAPVSTVLLDLERQATDSFLYDPADLQDPVLLSVKDVPFWDAVEALCRAAPMLTWESSGRSLRFLRRDRPSYPVKNQGEFTVWLDGITLNRDFDFTGNSRSTFVIVVASAWEAGIVPVAIDQKITEVLDEDGTNLIASDRFPSFGSRMDMPSGRIRKDSVYTQLPQGLASLRKFSRVKGYSAFYFPRSYQDVTIDLQTTSAPVQLDRLSLAVRNFRTLKDACALEVILTSATSAGEPMLDRLPVSDIVIVDDLGGEHRPPASSPSHSFSGTSYTVHQNLTVPFPEGRIAKTLRLHVLREVLEKRVPFQFGDILLE